MCLGNFIITYILPRKEGLKNLFYKHILAKIDSNTAHVGLKRTSIHSYNLNQISPRKGYQNITSQNIYSPMFPSPSYLKSL